MTEDEMVKEHHRLNGCESEQALRQWRTEACMLQSVGKQSQSDMTQQLINSNNNPSCDFCAEDALRN